tara:strand:- start:156 stop:611 length:456 start_codon:yes stop_codon:yes gene_type:complete
MQTPHPSPLSTPFNNTSNFIDLANTGFYSGLTFHRVIDGFMNQFGCPNSRPGASGQPGTGGPPGNTTYAHPTSGAKYSRDAGGNIKDENIDRTSNAPGTLSMANTGRPNSGGSQFFINVANNVRACFFNNRITEFFTIIMVYNWRGIPAYD